MPRLASLAPLLVLLLLVLLELLLLLLLLVLLALSLLLLVAQVLLVMVMMMVPMLRMLVRRIGVRSHGPSGCHLMVMVQVMIRVVGWVINHHVILVFLVHALLIDLVHFVKLLVNFLFLVLARLGCRGFWRELIVACAMRQPRSSWSYQIGPITLGLEGVSWPSV